MVLDLARFVTHHPGGKFNLVQNVGRDISKFFYGGYSLENNLGPKPSRGHSHSNYAKMIVNDLVVAVYEKSIQTQISECYSDLKLTEMWNESTGTVYLKTLDQTKVANFRSFFPGLEFIGKHYKVRAFNNFNFDASTSKLSYKIMEKKLDVERHYTICNVMRRSFYEPLLDCLQTGNSREQISAVLQS